MSAETAALQSRLSVLKTGIEEVTNRVTSLKARAMELTGRIERDRDFRRMKSMRAKLGL